MRISDQLDTTASRTPDKEAFVFGATRLSFEQANARVHAIASALRRSPLLEPHAHVGIYCPNNIDVLLLQLGINRADMVWAALHDRNPAEINARLGDYLDCTALFFHSSHQAAVDTLKEALPRVKLWICIDADSTHGVSLDAWIEGGSTSLDHTAPDYGRVACIFPTGGTTGPSKGVCHTHQGLAFMMAGLVDAWEMDAQTRILSVAPLSHAAGLFALSAIPNGGTNVILPGFDVGEVLRSVSAERITHLFLPPTALYALMAHPETTKSDTSSLRCLIVGAAPVAPEKFKEAVRMFGSIVHEGYAQSETGMPVLNKHPADYLRADGSIDEAVVRSTGRAGPFLRVEIVDDEGRPVPRGERGEIAVRGGQLMKGYYKRDSDSDDVNRNGFHLTGDVGIMDQAGYVTIVDRKKDMIVTGGFNVYPAEVEAVMNGHDSVLDCIVVGVPDEKWGEAIRALVQLKPGKSADVDELLAFCKERLGSVKAPKAVDVVETLPRSPVGKLLRREARAPFWKGHWRAV